MIRLVDRPLFWAICLGLFSQAQMLAIGLGIVFELLWLDILALGLLVPPYGTLGFLLLFPVALQNNWSSPNYLFLPLLFCMFCAYLASSLEQYQRQLHNIVAVQVVEWCRNPLRGWSPSLAIAYSVILRALSQGLLYIACFFILNLFGPYLVDLGAKYLPNVTWGMFYAAAITGAVLSLRIRRAYFVFSLAILFLAIGLWLILANF